MTEQEMMERFVRASEAFISRLDDIKTFQCENTYCKYYQDKFEVKSTLLTLYPTMQECEYCGHKCKELGVTK